MSNRLSRAFTDTKPPDLAFEILPDLSPFDFTTKPTPPYRRRPLFGTDIFRGEITIVPAPGGSGKSTWVSAVAVSCATGRTLLHDQPHKKLRVLFVNAEDSRGEALMRLEAVMRYHGIPETELACLDVIGSEKAAQFGLTEVNAGTRRDQLRQQGVTALRLCSAACRADLIFLDPLVALAPVGQLDNGLMSTVMTALREIAGELDCGIVVVSHTRKGANIAVDGADANSGAAAITNRARVVVGFSPVNEDDAKHIGIFPGEAWRYKFIFNVKANLAPIRERRIIELVSVGMGNASAEYPTEDSVAVAIPFLPPTGGASWVTPQMERATLVAIAQGFQGPLGLVNLSPKPSGSGRAYLHVCVPALAPYLPGRSPDAIMSAAKTLVIDMTKRGWIDAISIVIPKASGGTNKARGLVVRWGATPWANDPRPGNFTV